MFAPQGSYRAHTEECSVCRPDTTGCEAGAEAWGRYRVAVIGSRTLYPYDQVLNAVRALAACHGSGLTIVSGDAEGVDECAKDVAMVLRLTYEEFPADWKKWGRAAGPIRNKKMLPTVDRVVAFWDGKSPGTKQAIRFATQQQIPCTAHRLAPEAPKPRTGRPGRFFI